MEATKARGYQVGSVRQGQWCRRTEEGRIPTAACVALAASDNRARIHGHTSGAPRPRQLWCDSNRPTLKAFASPDP